MFTNVSNDLIQFMNNRFEMPVWRLFLCLCNLAGAIQNVPCLGHGHSLENVRSHIIITHGKSKKNEI